MTDPLLSSDPDVRANYEAEMKQAMQRAIEEDRAQRHKDRPETPPTIIGAFGRPNGISEALQP